jgi:hypothetical protein
VAALAGSGVVHGMNLPHTPARVYAVVDSDSDTIPAAVNDKPFSRRSDSPDPLAEHSEKSWNPLAPVVLVHNRKKRLATHAEDQRWRAGTNSRYAIVVSSEARVLHVYTERHLSRKGKSMICRRMMILSSKSGARKSFAKRRTEQKDATTASRAGLHTTSSTSRPRVWSLAALKFAKC